MDKFLQNNTVVKALSLLLAFMLWIIVNIDVQPNSAISQQQTGQRTITNVIAEIDYDQELYYLLEAERTVQVNLTGHRALVSFFRDPFRIYVDATQLGPGEHFVQVRHEGFPDELQVNIQPSTLRIVLEEKDVQAFNVSIELVGNVEEGFQVGDPRIVPSEVYVMAPQSILEEAAFVRGFVNIDNARQNINQKVQLKVFDQEGNELDADLSTPEVDVEVPVRSPSRVLPVEVILENQPPSGIVFGGYELLTPNIELFAPLHVLNDLTAIPITINLADYSSTTFEEIEVPLARGWLDMQPNTVRIRLLAGPPSQRTVTNVPVQVSGLADNLELQFLNPENGAINVDLGGNQDRLQQIRRQDLEAVLDVTGLAAGSYTREIALALPGFVELASPVYVNFRLIEAEAEAFQQDGGDTEGE